MRFGSVDSFLEEGGHGARLGRPVANESMLRALLTHGSWDEYRFFCFDVAHARSFLQRIEQLLPDPALRKRVQALPQAQLVDSLRRDRYQVFHQGDFTSKGPPLVALRNRVARHSFPVTGVTHSLDGALLQQRFLELSLAGLAPWDGVICTSRAAVGMVEAKGREVALQLQARFGCPPPQQLKTAWVPLGIDESLFQGPPRAEARRFFGFPEGMTVALSVGRFSLRSKADLSPLLELLARLRSAGELGRFVLLLAGGGEPAAVQLVEQLIARFQLGQTVLLLPNFAPEHKAALYRAADLYLSIVDNYQETFGLSVVEAMAAGLPVICSDFDGYRDLVHEGENGFRVPTLAGAELPPFLGEALALLDPTVARLYQAQQVAVELGVLRERLLALLASPALREEQGLRSRALAEQYRWPGLIRRYEAFWAELGTLAEAGPPPPPGDRLLGGEGLSAFGHFPTRLLAAQDRLALTALGRALLREPGLVTRYDDLQAVLDPALERLLLGQLATGPARLSALVDSARAQLASHPGQVTFQLLWLAKHGAIAVEPSAA